MLRPSVLSLLISTLVLFSVESRSQVSTANAKDLSFAKPDGWYEINSEQRTANWKKFEFTEEDLEKLLSNEKSTTVIAVFHRDDVSKVAGITPTIQVLLRPVRGSPTFDQFKAAFVRSLREAPGLEDYSLLGEPETSEVSGIRSVLSNSRFSLIHRSKRYTIRARTYAIPRRNHFIQISMSGEDNDGWTEKEFTNFISSVTITK